STPFIKRIEDGYREGDGFVFAADLECIAGSVRQARNGSALAPLGNVRHLIVEQRENGAIADTRALMTFNGPRQGVFGWLSRPSPRSVLDYVTAQAAAAP